MFTPNKINVKDGVVEIELLHGQKSVIDAEDYERIKMFRWYAYFDRTTESFYCRKNIGNKALFLHRLIAEAPEGMQVDHINHCTLDNRKANLRVCTQNGNQHNSRLRKDNKTGYKGVSFKKENKKYSCKIVYNGNQIFLGYFREAKDAARAYNLKAEELFGEYASLNIIKDEACNGTI